MAQGEGEYAWSVDQSREESGRKRPALVDEETRKSTDEPTCVQFSCTLTPTQGGNTPSPALL
eukprot:1017742-Pyramimonas_sp.AAC.1